MAASQPFVLLDDARPKGAADAQLFEAPREIFVARRAAEVADVLARANAAQRSDGGTLAGYLAYEAGLALEAKLRPLADARSGANGPLIWLGLFDACQTIPAADIPAWLAARAPGPASLGPLEPQLSPGGYACAFTHMQAAIEAGDVYQANLTFPLAGATLGSPLGIYAALRPAAAAGYGGVVFDGSHWLLSLSPELFFAARDGGACAKPMKGTRPRAADRARDTALRDELAGSPKDRAENLMIVDLMRNDLSRVAVPGSVRVDAPFAVESYPTVHQMVSTVRATLLPGTGACDLVRALFPCGSITGAPKIRAMELIDGAERDARGPYCGAIGWIDGGTGDAAFNVAIRTMRLTPGENGRGRAVMGVGSAIVADSNALAEWRECLVKGDFVRQAAAGFDLIETMRFDPANGIAHIELHLERLKRSAAELGFTFDRHAARNQIQALCFELDTSARLRLMLAKGGATSLETAPLPGALPNPAQCIVLPLPVDPGDFRLRHKTTDRGFYDDAARVARLNDAVEALLIGPNGLLTEGSFTNIFVRRGDLLLTPPARLGLLPGVLRHSLIDSGEAVEAELRIADLLGGFFIGNALRGLIPARLAGV